MTSSGEGTAAEWTVDKAVTKLTQTLSARDAAVTALTDTAGGIDWRQTPHYQPGCTECQLWRPRFVCVQHAGS